jgi:hypothetical protein
LITLAEQAEAEITDEEFNRAREQLGALPDFGLDCQARAERELADAGHRSPSMRLVIVRAAELATRPDGAT